ncbi:hypothetical protein ACIQV3_36030 [Streptomyces sp. NPDC099050]|uniref:hypothetical protein n=1 Tax=Streptomyces sp. NPDC099050 TaxID=3366100 RepID=UPI0037FDD6CE
MSLGTFHQSVVWLLYVLAVGLAGLGVFGLIVGRELRGKSGIAFAGALMAAIFATLLWWLA